MPKQERFFELSAEHSRAVLADAVTAWIVTIPAAAAMAVIFHWLSKPFG